MSMAAPVNVVNDITILQVEFDATMLPPDKRSLTVSEPSQKEKGNLSVWS